MANYKVHIKSDSNAITYKVNETILITIEYQSDINKYLVSTPNTSTEADSLREANNIARVKISTLFSSVGTIPVFIED